MTAKLSDVKVALAEKYERLARVASSKVKKRKFIHKAHQYRRQVVQLSGH
jgi:hypothetical protein